MIPMRKQSKEACPSDSEFCNVLYNQQLILSPTDEHLKKKATREWKNIYNNLGR